METESRGNLARTVGGESNHDGIVRCRGEVLAGVGRLAVVVANPCDAGQQVEFAPVVGHVVVFHVEREREVAERLVGTQPYRVAHQFLVGECLGPFDLAVEKESRISSRCSRATGFVRSS